MRENPIGEKKRTGRSLVLGLGQLLVMVNLDGQDGREWAGTLMGLAQVLLPSQVYGIK